MEVEPVGSVPEMSPELALAHDWRRSNDVAQVQRLTVLADFRRQGIATLLCQTAFEWCRDNGFRAAVLNTTSAQIPAISLYRKLGFREVGRSYLGKFELVWFELAL